MSDRGRGRPPGGPSRKRKPEEDLSTNPHTKKARARTDALPAERRKYETAKKNFNQQWSRLKTKLHQRADYLDADEATKKALEDAAFNNHSADYIRKGKHHDLFKDEAFAVSTFKAGEIPWDDNNPLWEDINDLTEEDDYQLASINEMLNQNESQAAVLPKTDEQIEQQKIMV
ncbi:hypothetical protein H9Q70_007386 [Fusarium xylarioides]|nr:hypothetical protein H9Q70_007386 [Fusarium xylarioides]